MSAVFASTLVAILSTLSASAQSNPQSSGAYLSAPPEYAPGDSLTVHSPTLDAGILAYRAGQDALAIDTLNSWVESRQGPWGEKRANGRFLLGWLLKEAGRFNEASTQFAIVRNSEVPLSQEAAWWEAWVDLQRGRDLVSARECVQYRRLWPYGVHFEECLLLMADAYKAAGHNRTARDTYNLWLTENPSSLVRDRVILSLAELEVLNGWSRGYSRLSDLILTSRDPLTVADAHAELIRNMESGATISPPSPITVAKGTVESLIQRGAVDAAWLLFLQSGGNDTSAAIGEWSLAEQRRVMWRTRHYDEYVESQMEGYLLTPSGETGWRIFRGYQKGGRFALAAEWGERMMASHPRHGRWSRNHDHIAQMWQLHGDYTKARQHWRQTAQRRGSIGRTGRWYVAWTTFRLGEFEQAGELFLEIIEADAEHKLAASYYLGRTHQASGDLTGALEQYGTTISEAPNSWYGELSSLRMRQLRAPEQAIGANTTNIGDVGWQATTHEEIGLQLPPYSPAGSIRGTRPLTSNTNVLIATAAPSSPQLINWSTVRDEGLPYQYPQAPDEALEETAEQAEPNSTLYSIQDSYTDNPHFDAEHSSDLFERFVANNKHIWSDLPEIQSLASIGLYELAGPMMESIRVEYRDARLEQGPRAAVVRSAAVSSAIWRAASRHCRDHNTVARSVSQRVGGHHTVDIADPTSLWLSFPTAHLDKLTEHGENHNVDPLLGLSVVRQESLYRATAESRVGANGLMQVMPITGRRIAASLNESFSPALLSQPETNIRYGMWYLSQLIDRFEGSWPMALAGYNAGPMNVSAWFRPWIGEIEIDDFVEQIPFRETREYVKSVVGYYSIHLALYRPASSVRLSFPTGHDHPEVIDY